MDLFPAIDLRAGRVVRMRRGDPGSELVYDPDPFAVARRYAEAGARWVHVIDLDRVFGFGEQTRLIAELARGAGLRVQAGGGVDTVEHAAAVLASGVERVIVRAAAGGGPGGLEAFARRLGAERLALAVDARGGLVELDGEGRTVSAVGLARGAVRAGIRTVVYTDLGREGGLGGADVAGAAALSRDGGVAVIVSGGVSALEDLRAIRDAGLAGAVVGRALFEGRFSLREALACSSS
ncbi:MAG TPA: HisA/HisF-related TIM barrel protein [Gemmatimonadales bacterium]|nr:HisA/HisF-related TIM barrel protein [Gemmatimonadales bacterium]